MTASRCRILRCNHSACVENTYTLWTHELIHELVPLSRHFHAAASRHKVSFDISQSIITYWLHINCVFYDLSGESLKLTGSQFANSVEWTPYASFDIFSATLGESIVVWCISASQTHLPIIRPDWFGIIYKCPFLTVVVKNCSDWSTGQVTEHRDGVQAILLGVLHVISLLATWLLNFMTCRRETIRKIVW